MSQQTLLDKALALPLGRQKGQKPDDELLDLVVAFLHDRITLQNAATAAGWSRQNVYSRIATVLRNGVRHGQITITRTKDSR